MHFSTRWLPVALLSAAALAQMPGPGAAGGAPMAGMMQGPRPAPAKSPPLDLALTAVQTAMALCKQQGHEIAVVVADASGAVRAGMVPDSKPAMFFNFAQRKIATALEFKMSSAQVQALAQTDRTVADKLAANPALFALPGALLIKKGDELLGVIAGAGAKSEEDEACAKAGLDQIQSKL